MKKRLFFSAQVVLLSLCIGSLFVLVFQLSGNFNPLARFDHAKPSYNRIEAYDPSLARLNSLTKLRQYCDSIYSEQVFTGKSAGFENVYTDIVSSVVRDRFFHGYSYYSFEDNYMAAMLSKVTVPGLSALVIPDEILKYPYAACSQQAIVMMELLQSKGFKTRKIAFDDKTIYGGHFAFEVFYEGKWHFHDPDMEPDKTVLTNYGRPGIDFLVHNKDILLQAYHRYSQQEIVAVFSSYSYGAVNKFPAPKAAIFQNVNILGLLKKIC